jgi:sec-independent protein translocase protein TatA
VQSGVSAPVFFLALIDFIELGRRGRPKHSRFNLSSLFTDQGGRMFEGLFQPMHLIFLAGLALIIFGPRKLPELGKGLGEGIRGFKSAMAGKDEAISAKPEKTRDHAEAVKAD